MKIPCPAPGVYYSVPPATYHAWDAVGSTLIKSFARNPLTCLAPYEASDDVNVGSGVHAYCLQGMKGLMDECAIMPVECDGISKAAKEARDTFKLRHPGKNLLPPFCGTGSNKIAIMDVLKGVDHSLKTHPAIGPILSRSKVEVSLVWRDTESGCNCKARLDVWDEKKRTIWDVKKTRNINGLKWELDDGYRYRLQAAHYLNGAIACGLNPVAFGFMACETADPYEVMAIYSDLEKTETAQQQVVELIQLIKQSKSANYWPNLSPPVGLSNWDELDPDSLIAVW